MSDSNKPSPHFMMLETNWNVTCQVILLWELFQGWVSAICCTKGSLIIQNNKRGFCRGKNGSRHKKRRFWPASVQQSKTDFVDYCVLSFCSPLVSVSWRIKVKGSLILSPPISTHHLGVSLEYGSQQQCAANPKHQLSICYWKTSITHLSPLFSIERVIGNSA